MSEKEEGNEEDVTVSIENDMRNPAVATSDQVWRPSVLEPYFKDKFEQFTELHAAARKGDVESAKLWLARGMVVNCRSHSTASALDAFTPLMFAAGRGHVDMCQLLLDSKADPLERSARHQTPLGLAVSGNHPEVVALLKPLQPTKQPSFAEREAAEHEEKMQKIEENKQKRLAKKAEVAAKIKAQKDAAEADGQGKGQNE